MLNGIIHLFQARYATPFSRICVLLVSIGIVSIAHVSSAATVSTRVGHVMMNDFNAGISAQSTQDAMLTIPDGETTHTYTFTPYTTPFQFNAVGVTYTGSIPLESVETYITATTHTGAPITRTLEMLGADSKAAPDRTYATYPVILEDVRTFTLSIVLTRMDGQSPAISDFDVIYVNTTTPTVSTLPGFSAATETADTTTSPSEEETTTNTNTNTAPSTTPEVVVDPAREVTTTPGALEIISRADWGADESYRYTTNQEVIWPEQYVDPEVFIVHHTAGSDGGDDPAATVRAIYYFHAVVYGWGDIGYNYLIDPEGHVYEGRAGGDSVVGGHAYNSVTNVGYNEGSVGISLLGCYEADSAGCNTVNDLSTAMKSSLIALIEKKAKKFNIDVSEQTTFHGSTVYRLIGHRDVAYTLCPGSITEDYIPTIREEIATWVNHENKKPFHAEFISSVFTDSSAAVVDQSALAPDTDYTLTITFKNTGYRTWKETKPFIKLFDNAARTLPSSLKSAAEKKRYGRTEMNEDIVHTDEEATFTVAVHTPPAGTLNINTYIKMYVHIKKIKGSPTTLDLGLSESTPVAE